MMLILNEEKYAKDVVTGQRDDVKSIKKKIELITRYNYHVLNKKSDKNYESTVKWLEKHHNIFNEQNYANLITEYVKRASKKPFYRIDAIKITKNEMEIIRGQNNLRHEKVLFVLLCMAKMQKIAHGYDNGLVAYTMTDLFKMARVSVPVDQREEILHDLLSLGLIGIPMKNDTRCLFVNFMEETEKDVALVLDERDCAELAYAYLYHIGQAKIKRCSSCGKLIKQAEKYGGVCVECQQKVDDPRVRLVWCVDCGEEFQVSINVANKDRCDNCQSIKNKEDTKNRVRKYRQSVFM